MSFTAEKHNIDQCPNRGLSVIQCGWQKCDGGHHRGPMQYQHYSITFVLRGCGEYVTNGRRHTITPGHGFVIAPGASTYYIADKDTPWEYIYAVFFGPDADALLRSAGLDEDHMTFQYEMSEDMVNGLFAMCKASRSGASKGYDVIGLFLLCMSRLIAARTNSSIDKNSPEEYVQAAITYMETNYVYNLSVKSIAEYVGIERSYLYRLFKEKRNCSPSEWLIQCRLRHALEMMAHSQFSLTEIAYSVGFCDAAHFTKSFKSVYGASPLEYRRKYFCQPNSSRSRPGQFPPPSFYVNYSEE